MGWLRSLLLTNYIGLRHQKTIRKASRQCSWRRIYLLTTHSDTANHIDTTWPDDIPRTYVPALTTINPTTPLKHKLPSFLNPLPSQLVDSESDINYLHSRGALTLPSVSLQNALMQAYIEYIYPYMPSIDLHDFLHIIDNRDGSAGKTSLLLYQCVMFAATGFVPMQALTEAGYSSRKEIRKQFFTKVRVGYTMEFIED